MYKRSKGDSLLHETWKKAKSASFEIVTKRLVTRRKTIGLDNADRAKYIVRSLFPHVEPSQRQDRSSCVVRRKELFTLEELKRAGWRLKANTAPGIDGVPNEILKEVIGAYPEILLAALNSCLREGRFFVDWKKQTLVLLSKGKKALEDASSYRPICLLDTMGKLLEEMILQRLQGHMVSENGHSEYQFGFPKGRSTVDGIQAVVDIATDARRKTGKRKAFCAMISIDIRNAFNTARWNICFEAMVRKKVPDYLLGMIDDYMSDSWVIYKGHKWSVKNEMTPAGTSIIGFADDALVVCATDEVKILELRINDSLWWAKRLLDSRCLKMAPENTEALLVTDRRFFKYPRIILGEHEMEWKKSIKYLGMQLDRRLSFSEHLQIATVKVMQYGAALTRLMPNIGGPREAMRRLVASVLSRRSTKTSLLSLCRNRVVTRLQN